MKVFHSLLRAASLGAILLIIFPHAGVSQESGAPDTSGPAIKVNKASKARIKFDNDNWNFGSIPKGVTVVHVFRFRNEGQDTLYITNVKPTCGCTTAPLSSSEIPPGKDAFIKAYFNTQNFNGRVTKQIFVDTSDPINPYLKLVFTAIINNPLESLVTSPSQANFDTVAIGQSKLVKVSISSTSTAPVDLAVLENPSESLVRVTLSKSQVTPKQAAELAFELQPQTGATEIKESITLEPKGMADSRITIPIKGIVAKLK